MSGMAARRLGGLGAIDKRGKRRRLGIGGDACRKVTEQVRAQGLVNAPGLSAATDLPQGIDTAYVTRPLLVLTPPYVPAAAMFWFL